MSDTLISPLDQRASLDSAEVAEKTGIKHKTLIKYAHVLGPKMGAFQPNGRWSGWRFKRKALEEWWASFDTGGRVINRRGRKSKLLIFLFLAFTLPVRPAHAFTMPTHPPQQEVAR